MNANESTGMLSLYESMARRRGQRSGHLYKSPGGDWMLRYRVDTPELDAKGNPKRERITKAIARWKGKDKISLRQAQTLAWDDYLSKVDATSKRPGSVQTLKEFIEERFRPDVIAKLKKGGRDHYSTILKMHLLPALGEVRLREISTQHVQDLLNLVIEKGRSVQTAVHVRNGVSAILRHAKSMQCFVGDLPTDHVRLPEMSRKGRRALRWEQVCEIAHRMTTPLATLVPFMALTGVRIGEAKALRRKWLNLTPEHHVVNADVIPPWCVAIRESFTRGKFETLKTDKSSRNIPIPDWFVPVLQDLLESSSRKNPDDLVFPAISGTPINNLATQRLKQAAALSGLGTAAVPAKKIAGRRKREKRKPAKSWVTWHTFRHTNSTLASIGGMTETERQRILGHSDVAMTMHYTHAELEIMRERWNKVVDKTKLLGSQKKENSGQ